MNTFELVKKFITNKQYQILDEDISDGHIAFRFQMNTIHLWINTDDEHFIFMTLPCLTNIPDENLMQVKEKCNHVNKDAKQVKLYVLDDIILAAAEIYYLAEEDFQFQMTMALKNLVVAKVMYKNK